MGKRKFRLKQVDMTGKDWRGLAFRSYMDTGESKVSFHDPIIAGVFGDDIDYGKLFAYCFRRFGYPERGWDDYKQLVSYYLTTPHPDLVLNVTPYVGDTSVLSLHFYVEMKSFAAIENYARRYRTAWEARLLDWIDQQGLPDWMAEWVEVYNTEYRSAFPNVPFADNWRQTFHFPFAIGEKGSKSNDLTSKLALFRKETHDAYSKIEAWPAYYDRPANMADWNDDDPLKPFAQAAKTALEDLLSPVGVRDQAINAMGKVASDRTTVRASASAGYPSGALGNIAGQEFADLHGLIMKMGKGNAKRGIKKVMEKLRNT